MVQPLLDVFEELAEKGLPTVSEVAGADEEGLLQALLGDEPTRTIGRMKDALLAGVSPVRLAQITALVAAERVVRFHTQNDFGDWISVLHT